MSEKMTATIEGYDAGRIEVMLVQFLADKFTTETLQTITIEARRRAAERVEMVAAATIDAEVARVLTEGWAETSPWGEETGKRWSLRGFLLDYLGRKTRDRNGAYDAPECTPVDRAIVRTIDAVFTREFQKEIEAAKARVRAAVDEKVTAKIAETLKSALGLR